MTKPELLIEIEKVQAELEALTGYVPANYEDFNQHRLKYETVMVRLQTLQLQHQAISMASALSAEIAETTP